MRCLLLVLGAGLLWVVPAALAQDGQRALPAEGGKRPAQSPETKGSWVKLCETPKAPAKDVLGKAQAAGVKSCLTFHELLDATTGTRLVAVGIRQSAERRTLTVIVPAGAHRRGHTFIYPRSVWKRVARGQGLAKHELEKVTTLKLAYTSCDAEECAAEIEATPELIEELRTKGGLAVDVIRNRRIALIQVSLGGFRAAFDGPGIDSVRFRKARDELLREIRERNRQRDRPRKRAGDREI